MGQLHRVWVSASVPEVASGGWVRSSRNTFRPEAAATTGSTGVADHRRLSRSTPDESAGAHDCLVNALHVNARWSGFPIQRTNTICKALFWDTWARRTYGETTSAALQLTRPEDHSYLTKRKNCGLIGLTRASTTKRSNLPFDSPAKRGNRVSGGKGNAS